jgi:hypothetical protein
MSPRSRREKRGQSRFRSDNRQAVYSSRGMSPSVTDVAPHRGVDLTSQRGLDVPLDQRVRLTLERDARRARHGGVYGADASRN